ncbi:MAG: hypothetical protein ABSG01_11440 [Anaerolineales bacterium]
MDFKALKNAPFAWEASTTLVVDVAAECKKHTPRIILHPPGLSTGFLAGTVDAR